MDTAPSMTSGVPPPAVRNGGADRDRPGDPFDGLLRREGLGQEVRIGGGDALLDVRLPREDEHRNGSQRGTPVALGEKLPAVSAGQIEVEHDELRADRAGA